MNRRWILGCIVALGLVLRLALAIKVGLSTPPEPGGDSEEYDTYAWNVAQGRGYRGMSPDVVDQDHLTAFRPPGTSLMWAGCYRIFGHCYGPVRVLNCLLGAAAIAVVYAIARRCFDEVTGLVSAGIFAVWPVALLFSTQLLSEPLGTLTFLLFLLLSIEFGLRRTWTTAVAAGVMLGLTILSRPNPLFMLVFTPVWALWQFRRNPRGLVGGLAISGVAICTMVPWWARNYAVFHAFIPISTMGGSSLLQGNNRVVANEPDLYGSSIWDTRIPEYRDALHNVNNELGRDRLARQLALDWIRANTHRLPAMIVNKLIRGWTPFLRPHTPRIYRLGTLVSWGPILVLFLIGFIPTLRLFLKTGHPGWILHVAVLSSLVLTVVLFGELRYRFMIEPVCIIIAAWVVVAAAKMMPRKPAATPNAAAASGRNESGVSAAAAPVK